MRTRWAALLVLGLAIVAGCKRKPATTPPAPDAVPEIPGNTQPPGPVKPTAKDGRGTFTVGKATTRITSPLGADGLIDYETAVNGRLSEGVTPENNAMVLIWQALGPNPIPGTPMPPGLFEKLGIPPPPADGNYFVGLRQYVARNPNLGSADAASETLNKIIHRFWTADQHPVIHSWLKANEKPLAAAVEGSKRTHYYSSLVAQRNANGSTGLWSSPLPGLQGVRELAQALEARAMLRAGRGQLDDSWKDLLACHRLGRLVGRGGLLIEGLIGVAIEQIACRADVVFVANTRPDAATIAGYIRDLRALPPMRTVADQIDLSERFAYLDTVMAVERQGMSAFTSIRSGDKLPKPPPDAMLNGIDWTSGMKSANHWYDFLVEAMRQKDRGSRNQKLADLEAEFAILEGSFLGPGHPALHDSSLPATARGKVVAEFFLVSLFPAGRKVQDAHDRSQQTVDNVATAFALAAHHHDSGKYPDSLADLAPKYLPQVPKDLFTGGALVYKPSADGYLLYSVGPNGKDDGGRTPEDQPAGDDIAVRMSPQ